jgi:hypothetical protein
VRTAVTGKLEGASSRRVGFATVVGVVENWYAGMTPRGVYGAQGGTIVTGDASRARGSEARWVIDRLPASSEAGRTPPPNALQCSITN